ncbi:hypothetical protein SUGI_0200600 [Cryptomeria japonica]|uniref:wax ester synthase/diacylglycerol acyltransferase 11 n=1 Tax=Cryptomeria japonica TaxID=3369 RepID=UPI002408BCEB|nr:wax ester synthase/diacylglycerol acyltransferase 11 [Cryptomeria japonica]GLJ12923.1 hypothetical protein SUGI_0200600 [Cryptomeria japonica]
MGDSDSGNRKQKNIIAIHGGSDDDAVIDVGDQPVTPFGRIFRRWDTVIYSMIFLKNEVDEDVLRAEFTQAILFNYRFCSVLVKDKKGKEFWQKTEIEIEKHIIVSELSPEDAKDESYPNKFLADLIFKCPLDEQRPLWDVHAFRVNLKDARGVFIIRVHHALGDGISLLSFALSRCRRVAEPDIPLVLPNPIRFPTDTRVHKFKVFHFIFLLWKLILFAWNTFIDVMYFALRIIWLQDSKMPVKGYAGVELWPKKLATAVFTISDMGVVKDAVNGTINDVLVTVISSGFRRYLEMKCPEMERKGLIEKLRLSGLCMVNTRMATGNQELSKLLKGDPTARWGNNMGFILLRLCLKKFKDPLDSVRLTKAMLERKKTSLEAIFTYAFAALVMKLMGTKAAACIDYRALANTTFTMSNVRGPSDEIMFAGNPLSFISATCSGLPQSITLHMVSYMGKAYLQVLVARDVIPDPEVLARCFEDSLKELKDAATMKTGVANGSTNGYHP